MSRNDQGRDEDISESMTHQKNVHVTSSKLWRSQKHCTAKRISNENSGSQDKVSDYKCLVQKSAAMIFVNAAYEKIRIRRVCFLVLWSHFSWNHENENLPVVAIAVFSYSWMKRNGDNRDKFLLLHRCHWAKQVVCFEGRCLFVCLRATLTSG